jgi:hypothetical protein
MPSNEVNLNFSNSPRSTTRNSIRAHRTTPNINPGKNPPPIVKLSLHSWPEKNSSTTSIMHTPVFAGTMYFANTSVTSSLSPGTGRLSAFIALSPPVFNPYPRIFFFCPTPLLSSFAFITPTFCGGNGKKYSVYALARKLVIASRFGRNVLMLSRSGMCRSAGTRGKSDRRRVYMRVEEVSWAERVEMRLDWSGGVLATVAFGEGGSSVLG